MDHESILIFITFVFTTVLYILILFKAPKLSVLKNPDTYVDNTKLPILAYFLSSVLIVSGLLGYFVMRDISLALKYAALNGFICGIMGGYLILYRHKKK